MPDNPTTRFTDRVDNYVRYRPGYPSELLAELATHAFTTCVNSVVADIGSGTGILTESLLVFDSHVFAIEPNAAMRAAAERQFHSNPRFTSINGTAEVTTLPARSVDLITAGQSFHWFDQAAARREFARILKPNGFVALIWNERETTGTPFLEKYNAILEKLATDYAHSRHKLVNDSMIAAFFAPATCEHFDFPTVQIFDREGLIGRAMSSSYAPNASHPNHEAFISALKELFAQEARNDRVEIRYRARLYLGKLT